MQFLELNAPYSGVASGGLMGRKIVMCGRPGEVDVRLLHYEHTRFKLLMNSGTPRAVDRCFEGCCILQCYRSNDSRYIRGVFDVCMGISRALRTIDKVLSN